MQHAPCLTQRRQHLQQAGTGAGCAARARSLVAATEIDDPWCMLQIASIGFSTRNQVVDGPRGVNFAG